MHALLASDACCEVGVQAFNMRSLLDASSSIPEDSWFIARKHWGSLSEYCQEWRGARSLTCLDVFSASQSFASVFTEHGYSAVAYDIKTDERCDVTSQEGFLLLLEWGLSILG